MRAHTPTEICALFQRAMIDGDVDEVLSVYEPQAVFVNQAGEVIDGRDEFRQIVAPLAAAKTRFDYDIKQVIEAGGIALMHTDWKVSGDDSTAMHAIEVARRQPDGTWRWLIGDPYTVGKRISSDSSAKRG